MKLFLDTAKVMAEEREVMMAQGKDLSQIADNIVVKVPLPGRNRRRLAFDGFGYPRQCHPGFLPGAGDPGGSHRRHFRLPAPREAGRHRE